MFRNIPTRDRQPRPTRQARLRARQQLRPTFNLLEDRMLLSVAPQTYTVMNLNDSGPGSLRDAIASANADSYSGFAFDTIEFDPSLAGQTIDLTTIGDSTEDGSSALAITAPILIDGSMAPGLTIARSSAAGTPDMRIFYVASAGNLSLNALTILGGQDTSGFGGGGLLNNGMAMVTNDTFIANFAADGGGLENNGTATLTGDTFTANSATDGGGLNIGQGGTATLTDVAFTDNVAAAGGGLNNGEGGTATLTGDTFTDNSATDGGGGLYNVGTATLTGDTFLANSATDGGGVLNQGTAMLPNQDIFTGNSATNVGGGLFNDIDATAMLTDDTFTSNSATSGGGLFNNVAATVTGGSNTFTSNSATYGGGLYNFDGFATLTGDNFTDNSATDGGGLYNFGNSTATLDEDAFTDNSATLGGGLFNDATATLTRNTFTGNSVTKGGGGLINFATATLTRDTFTGNSAPNGNGGGLANFVSATLTGDTFTDNSTAFGGGGLYNFSSGIVSLTGDTFTGNSSFSGGGGLDNDAGTATLYNTIVAGNYVFGSSYSTMPSEISGTVSGSNNLIGDPHSAGGLTDDSNGNIVGFGGVSPIALSTIFATDTNGIPLLANYGGPTQIVALVPGSPAIDAGSKSVPHYQNVDERGVEVVGAPDIGAFESEGFQLTISGGNGQTALVDQPFGSPLTVTVTAINPLDPVNGGRIFLGTPDPIDLASAFLSDYSPTIVNGMCSVTATANANPGVYLVTASVPESNEVAFVLTNQSSNAANIQAEINAAGPGGITLQPTAITPLNVILSTLAGLGPQTSGSKVTVSLPSTMSPYPAITVNLPAGLNFTLDGNGSSVSGNVTISQPGGAGITVDAVNTEGNLQIQVGNANNGSAVVTQSKVTGNVQIQAGNGNADSLTIRGLSVGGNAQIQAGNGNADSISADGLAVGGNLQIQTGNGDGDSVAVTAVSGPTTITGTTEIQLGNSAGDTATVNGPDGATFNGAFTLQMGNGGNSVNIGTVPGTVTFGGPVQVQLGNGTNTLNLAATITQSGGVPGSQVYFKKQAVFDGKNTRYVGASGVNVFGAPQFND